MSEHIRIHGARFSLEQGAGEAQDDLFLRDARLVGIGQAPADWPEQCEQLDATGMLALPAAIDLAVRLREPGESHKADMASELSAAAQSGIGRVCIAPDTKPVIDNPSVVEWIQRRREATGSPVKVSILGAMSEGLRGESLGAMDALIASGCAGVAQPDGLPESAMLLWRAMSYAAGTGVTLHLRPLDRLLAAQGCAHDGAIAAVRGLRGQATVAESAALGLIVELARETGARVHVGRISSARAVEILRAAKHDGVALSADVAAHQLMLDDSAIDGLDPRFHLQPPLRSADDRAALLAGVLDGTIDAVCSDHQPHEADAKCNPFSLTAAGGATIETLVPVVASVLNQAGASVQRIQQVLCAAPATVLGLPIPQITATANDGLVLIDLAQAWTVDDQALLSRGGHSPLHGMMLEAGIRAAWLGGLRTR